MKIIVAGSGPAGACAAMAALEQGAEVWMLDPGKQLPADTAAFKHRLAQKDAAAWSDDERHALITTQDNTKESLSQKRIFGSGFATQVTNGIQQERCSMMQTNAMGGLSNVWGRGVEPPYGDEAAHWPEYEAFKVSLQRILEAVPFCAQEDNLASVMPLYASPKHVHTIARASENLLGFWEKNAFRLNQEGIHFGKTRLLMRQGCQMCGMCFYGCVYDIMWSSDVLVRQLQSRYPAFKYHSGISVHRFSSSGTGVQIVAKSEAQEEKHFEADKLILACGSPQTTTIVMRSLGHDEATFKSSDLIKIPCISLLPARGEEKNGYHGLSQLTTSINHRGLTKKAMLIHWFGKNPAIDGAVVALFPKPLRPAVARVLMPVLSRLFIGMCFLHSDDSATLHLQQKQERFICTGYPHKQMRWRYIKLLTFLYRRVLKTGILPIPVPGALSLPGSSVHYGASVAVDAKGRIAQCPAVIVADAAGLPEIPAGSYTLSIMAHAHRVTTEAARQ